MLAGGNGDDRLAGGAGKDMFVFASKLNDTANVDRIIDFNGEVDTIVLDRSFFKALDIGRLDAGDFFLGWARKPRRRPMTTSSTTRAPALSITTLTAKAARRPPNSRSSTTAPTWASGTSSLWRDRASRHAARGGRRRSG